MNIITSNCAYASLIRQFIIQQFPRAAGAINSDDLLDLLTVLVLGNSKQRQGPNPKPESIVAIRSVIRDAVSRNAPIPFMVPWGAVKPDGSSLDVAELATLRTFERLHLEVSELYRPGVQMGIRLEDISMPYFLYPAGSNELRLELADAARYTSDFKAAVAVLGLKELVHIRPESDFVTIDQFAAAADAVRPDMERALQLYAQRESDQALQLLNGLGWKGGITFEMREHYLHLYRNMYPQLSDEGHYQAMARYFASALVRSPLKLRGDLPEWDGKFIDYALAQPVPGTESLFSRRVYRRAVSSQMSGRHVAPWRAKGYLSISENDTVSVKLRSFREAPDDLYEQITTLVSDDMVHSVNIRTDWRNE